jgi:hypothetical protein
MDRKAGLMRDLTQALAGAMEPTDIAGALRIATTRFAAFSKSAELPFDKAYGDRMADPPDEVRKHFSRHEDTIGEFIRALQRLKYEVALQRYEEIRAAIAAFEFATCTIPPPGTDRAS